jgi:hypothetical protein
VARVPSATAAGAPERLDQLTITFVFLSFYLIVAQLSDGQSSKMHAVEFILELIENQGVF